MASSLSELFTDIADAIRTKTGGTDTIVANDFPSEILSIPVSDALENSISGTINLEVVPNRTSFVIPSVPFSKIKYINLIFDGTYSMGYDEDSWVTCVYDENLNTGLSTGKWYGLYFASRSVEKTVTSALNTYLNMSFENSSIMITSNGYYFPSGSCKYLIIGE